MKLDSTLLREAGLVDALGFHTNESGADGPRPACNQFRSFGVAGQVLDHSSIGSTDELGISGRQWSHQVLATHEALPLTHTQWLERLFLDACTGVPNVPFHHRRLSEVLRQS